MIGVDFDNTIVCYDRLIHQTACEWRLIPTEIASSKSAVRNYLRAHGQEDAWTELQGYIYGKGMRYADPFPGVLEFFALCRERSVPVGIISHRTAQPFKGPAYDLHQAAHEWIQRHGFYDEARIGLSSAQVFFELTKAGKLTRIAKMDCKFFVDDLPEFLGEPGFPKGVEKILFDPGEHCNDENRFRRVKSWHELFDWLVARA